MISKKLHVVVVLLVAGNSLQAGITFGKIAEFPMRLCLGAAMLYTGNKTYEYARTVGAIEELEKGDIKISTNDLLEGLKTAKILLAQGIKKGSKPEKVKEEYFFKAIGSAFMTLGIGYYFFFK
jgi:hypothetical protein